MFQNLCYRSLDRAAFRDVSMQRDCTVTQLCLCARCRFHVPVEYGDRSSRAHVGQGAFKADAVPAAGYDNHLIFQIAGHGLSSLQWSSAVSANRSAGWGMSFDSATNIRQKRDSGPSLYLSCQLASPSYGTSEFIISAQNEAPLNITAEIPDWQEKSGKS